MPEPTEPMRTLARIRYRADLVPATVYAEPGARARVVFDEPQRAVTPGQAVVFYDGEYVRRRRHDRRADVACRRLDDARTT